ncbi:uncharacterized protein LOC115007188 isoform X2 [Cottoperca gobio]|uniref:Uncharacterized protein LOC115007188 isoform X2 n=1 Tax=Cottoperca gobio TaxID=56716 RepID=A0A6J2PIA2_COTGO|nr:uncharacterized protein LOC115007188 isoform X2 [Cottoperca gobio]
MKPVGTYVKYNAKNSYEKFPTLSLDILGKKIVFLVDSGATHSVVKISDLPDCKLSGRYIHSIGAAGVTVKERFSMPVKCTDIGDNSHPFPSSVKHSFLLSSVCPINFMGRDLILQFGLNLISTDEGLEVRRSSPIMLNTALWQPDTSFVCLWLLNFPVSEKLIHLTHQRVLSNAVFMPNDHLHCTVHVDEGGASQCFQQDFLMDDINDEIMLKTMYWSSLRNAISVTLTLPQSALYQVSGAVPHVSLAKAPADKWQDLGPLVKDWESPDDWQPTHTHHLLCTLPLKTSIKMTSTVQHTHSALQYALTLKTLQECLLHKVHTLQMFLISHWLCQMFQEHYGQLTNMM